MSYNLSELRVLVVDDSENMRQIIRRILRIFSIREVQMAGDGSEALKIAGSLCPDLVLTNWEMAPMNGLDFVRAIRSREESPNLFLPIIMISGHTDARRVVEARNAGVNEFVAKPLSAKALYARIKRVIEKPRSFIDSGTYFGPDRRVRQTEFDGPEKRADATATPAGADEEPEIDWA